VIQSITPYYKVLLQYYSVLQSTTPVLLWTTKYYSSTTLYYKVLLQYYSVLQSISPVLLFQYYSVLQSTIPVPLCTTKYYSSTTLYYKVLFQYYSVLQSTTPVLLCTTKYYSSTTLYYKVLVQYYSVLESTTPVLLCTTEYYNVQYRITYETSFTLRGATRVTLQLHQILRLPHKVTLMIVVPHIWNVIYNARSNRSHLPTSPNTAPATQNESRDWFSSHMKRHLQCAEQPHQILRLPRNSEVKISTWHPWIVSAKIKTIRGYPTISDDKIVISHPPLRRPYSYHLGDAFCIEKYNISRSGYLSNFHEILRLPHKMNLMLDPPHLWNVIYNRRKNKSHNPTAPNSAPAPQNAETIHSYSKDIINYWRELFHRNNLVSIKRFRQYLAFASIYAIHLKKHNKKQKYKRNKEVWKH